MRWKKHVPAMGDIRTRRRLLLFPMEINGDFRWFEVGVWRERYNDHTRAWVPIDWVDPPASVDGDLEL